MDAGLAYELIASRSELEQIVGGEPAGPSRSRTSGRSRGWRRELVGSDLRDLLAGRRAVSVGAGRRLELSPNPPPA